MANQFGRISGPLLADNLKRNGINLAFDNQLLYLDVVNNRVGFNSLSPVNDLFTPTAIDSIGLLVDNTADIGNFIISTSTIQNPLGTITISPNQSSNPTIVVPQLSTANLLFSGNTISDSVQDDSINITANGTGLINLNNNTVVTGNLHATGNITWDGNITLGNSSSDTINFVAEVNSNILPSTTNTDDLGSNSLQWLTAYSSNLNSSTAVISNSATVTNLTLGNIRFNSNNISNVNSSNNISFVTSGTGVVNFNGTNYVNVNSINSPLGNLVLASTGDGFVQFNGTAIAIPLGDTATRPNSPQVGTMRFNTDLQYEEVFDGTTWLQLSGSQTKNLTEDQIADTTWTWDIILG